jgi:hypothetical protein
MVSHGSGMRMGDGGGNMVELSIDCVLACRYWRRSERLARKRAEVL